ncbi:hypothetical protein DRP53_05650 [candidate division WOR-3 bacterium]|uniref:Cell division protein FtsL n=1 Tax=candidate division WOR-3 bacterium TaxID=2052148 RepID=A0A660SHL3_UNCW3|nr:MAG: hypothetical protein DRP53_05650 [candidate division WOR-3 bacterium]
MKIIGYLFIAILILFAYVWKESKLTQFSIELERLKTERECLVGERERLLGILSVEASVVEMERKALQLGLVFPSRDDIVEVWHR